MSDSETIAAGYAFTGPALDLGALLWEGSCLPDAQIRVPLPMPNRHGLVAGATGTGTGKTKTKTKTHQLIAEQLSALWAWLCSSRRTDRPGSGRGL